MSLFILCFSRLSDTYLLVSMRHSGLVVPGLCGESIKSSISFKEYSMLVCGSVVFRCFSSISIRFSDSFSVVSPISRLNCGVLARAATSDVVVADPVA